MNGMNGISGVPLTTIPVVHSRLCLIATGHKVGSPFLGGVQKHSGYVHQPGNTGRRTRGHVQLYLSPTEDGDLFHLLHITDQRANNGEVTREDAVLFLESNESEDPK